MENKNLGDQGRELLNDIMSGDYSQLNDKVKVFSQSAIEEFNKATMDFQGKVQPAIDESKKQVMNSVKIARESMLNAKKQARDVYGGAYKKEVTVTKKKISKEKRKASKSNQECPQVNNKYHIIKVQNSHTGAALLGTGIAGLSLFGTAAVVLGCIWAVTGFFIVPLEILTVVFTGVSLLNIGILRMGLKRKRFYKRYETYYNMLVKNGFCEIKEMAGRLGYPKRKVIKDLRKMISIGMFPEGHFDEKKILFIGNDEIFEQYMDARKGYEQRAWEEQVAKSKEEKTTEEKPAEEEKVSDEVAKALEEGKDVLEKLQNAKQMISNQEVAQKITNLEVLISKIFACVKKHPEKLSEIHKFMEYYLPITVKLITAYKEFEAQPIQGDNISKSKKEIEDTLDTIAIAFEKLLDSLYEGEAMEVSSDISVLQALFAQEGLTKKDFEI